MVKREEMEGEAGKGWREKMEGMEVKEGGGRRHERVTTHPNATITILMKKVGSFFQLLRLP